MVSLRLVLLLWFAVGCSPTLRVESQPVGAVIELSGGERLVTPATVPASRWPMKRQQVTLSASGYRRLEARMPYAGSGPWSVVLVPEHGPVGSWDESDLP